MKKASHIQKSFVISYIAIAVLGLASGLIGKYYLPEASADIVTGSGRIVMSTDCAANAPVLQSASTLSAQEIIDYGASAQAWVIKTQQSKIFRIIIAASEIIKSAPGGEVQFTVALGNMNTATYSDKFGKIWIVASDSTTPLELLYDTNNSLNLAPGKYWVGKATKTIKDYSSTKIGVMLVNGGGGDKGTDPHRQGCIPNAIDLNQVINGVVSTATATASVTATSGTVSQVQWVLPSGFSAQYVPATYAGLKANSILNAGMYIYRFNVDGTKTWKIYTIADAATVLTPGVGYYVYNPGASANISLDEDPTYTEKVVLRKGWNLVANSTSGAVALGGQSFPIINSVADNTCNILDTCFTTETVSQAVGEGRVYTNAFLIVNKTATDASVAFQTIDISATNVAAATIPLATPYWIYISN
jgi:hypothetical protein